MAVYAMSEASIAEQARRMRKVQIWVHLVVVALLATAGLFRARRPDAHYFFEAACVALFVGLVQLVQPYPWRRSSRALVEQAAFVVEITPDDIRVENKWHSRQIATQEIVRAEEPSWGSGLYLRSSNRYRWVLIPRCIDGFEEIRSYLATIGVPFATTTTPPNWEEFLFPVLFCGSLLCDLVVSNQIVLLVNVGVALLLALAGHFYSNAVEDHGLRLKVWLGSFIPLVAGLVSVSIRVAKL